jgi:tellurite resistance protein TerC
MSYRARLPDCKCGLPGKLPIAGSSLYRSGRFWRRFLAFTCHYVGEAFVVREDGIRKYRPLFVVIVMVAVTDVIFAVDSIPAIFAITTDPFIVLTSNVFAVLGLCALYFLLAGIDEKFHLLSYGLAAVLIFIGANMLVVDFYKIPIATSLGVVAALIASAMLFSLAIKPAAKPNP